MRFLVLVSLIFSYHTALADFFDGNRLKEWMDEKEQENGSRFEAGLFNGYVAGVVDAGNEILFCTPDGVTAGQFTAVVTKYLKENPEKWNLGASSLVIDALKVAFPCKKT
jgi:hypothetical protein